MTPPAVYNAIRLVAADISKVGVAKASRNQADGYAYRSIDDVVGAISPLLVKRGLCILPRITERISEQNGPTAFVRVCIKGAFEFVASKDGSRHVVETFGEALDHSDKATNKALTAAYKSALIQTFCIPVKSVPDADAGSPSPLYPGTPACGWLRWADDFMASVRACGAVDELDRLTMTQQRALRTLAGVEREKFEAVGLVVSARRLALQTMPNSAAEYSSTEGDLENAA